MALSDDNKPLLSAVDPHEKRPIPKFEERVLNTLRLHSILLIAILLVVIAIGYKIFFGSGATAQTLNNGAKVEIIKQTETGTPSQWLTKYISQI